MPSIYLFYIFLTAIFVVLILIPPITRLAVNLEQLDEPNERKIHSGKIPRLAGIAIFLAFLFSTLLFCDIDRTMRGFLAGGIVIFATGLYDDLVGMRARWKLLGEVVAAMVAILIGNMALRNLGDLFGSGDIFLGPLAIPFTVLGIVGVTNAINLLDGLDGLAGGVSTIAAMALGLLAFMVGDQNLLCLIVALIGALLGFLKFNTYPARIFMGDSGSLFLGYSLSIFAVILCTGENTRISAVTPLLILMVPIVDTLMVMVTRQLSGKPIFSPDNSHIHHRLLGVGFGHKATVIIIYSLSYLLAIIGVTISDFSDFHQLLILLPIVLVLTLLHRFISPQMLDRLPCLKSDESLKQSADYLIIFKYSEMIVSLVKYQVITVFCLCIFFASGFSTNAPIISFLLLVLSVSLLFMTHDWCNRFLHFIIYLDGAYLIFLVENYGRSSTLGSVPLHYLSHGLFLLMLICCGLKFYIDRRVRGLMQSPLEYLLFLIILSVPLLPPELLLQYHLLTVLAKTVILFAVYRMVLLRKGWCNRWIIVATLLALLVVAGKGLF